MSGIDFIQDLGLVMLIAAAAAWICHRISLPVVIGYITAGIRSHCTRSPRNGSARIGP